MVAVIQPGAKGWTRVLRLLAAGLLILIMFRWFERAQVYHPGRELKATGAELGRPFEDVRLRTEDDVELHAWFFPADAAIGRGVRVFLVCHGNAGNISHRLGLCAALLRTGASVLVFDYRGYGRSSGRPSEEGTYRDVQAAFRWLRAKGFGAEQIVVFGESLGGAVATELAVREPLGGVVLQSTFTSIPDMGAELFPWLPVRWLGTIRYDTLGKLPRLRVPLLILHSRQDDLVAFRHAERNYAAANEPKRLGELGGGHNDPVFEQPAFQQVLQEWLRSLPQSDGS